MASILVLGCTSQNPINPSGEKVKVAFTISANDKNDTVTVFADKGANAFEVMKQNLKVDFKSTAYGPFINGINGINSGTDNYWALYVDGVYAMKGIDQFVLDKDTKLEWKLEKIN
ncbi:MAG: DUF4430 domain-containing protein [Candidatus Diapherotrites archaeon]|nr:DUF4430 domain-containing protein [Candidatus Diapherotrites archaeon]